MYEPSNPPTPRVERLEKALDEIKELAYDRVDIDDEGRPNFAMQIQQIALAALEQDSAATTS
jgi:hypothetical protein